MTYLDASAVVSLFIADKHSPIIRGYLRDQRPTVVIGDFAVAEFSAAVSRRVRMGEVTPAQGSHLLNVFDAWVAANAEPLDTEPSDVRVASAFVRRFELGLRAPDALHLAMCQRLDAALLSFDVRQTGAARQLGLRVDPGTPPAS